ncbi:hypothetical protein ACQ4M3_16445 [Leptolyngbya sp. AN03gr2]|uniref:hypothetical protein n=1 Tax=unclassified Leptolyngbya TaxID=2650499 RepID=UPI003D31C699
MKRVILSALSVLTLSSFVAPAAFAESPTEQKTAVVSSTLNRSTSLQVTPNVLVTSAYRGSYLNQGIPSHAQLHHAYVSGQVTAEDLIRVAIAQGQLSPEALSDTGYVNTVDAKLGSFSQ